MAKQLYRSRNNAMIAGVCAGLGEYFDVDPVIIRIIFVVLTFGHGLGILIYIVLWLLLPERPLTVNDQGEIAEQPTSKKTDTKKEKAIPQEEPLKGHRVEDLKIQSRFRERTSITAGLVLVVLGAIFLAQNFDPTLNISRLWPLLLLAFGLGMLWKASRKL